MRLTSFRLGLPSWESRAVVRTTGRTALTCPCPPVPELVGPAGTSSPSKALSLLGVSVFSRGLKKSSQELYGLICYGELRKKVGGCEYGAPGLLQCSWLGM